MRGTMRMMVTLLAFSMVSTVALADPPALVGRVSSVQGEVTIGGGGNEQPGLASLNWPVTTDNQITTGRGARAEFRVGSATVRLDGGTALVVDELDDDRFSLQVSRGSISVRVRDPDMLDGFEVSTPDARVVLTQPGRVRIDADAVNGSAISVFEGTAQIEGAGTTLTLNAGRRAGLHGGDLLTGSLVLDNFDDWPEARVASAQTLQYVTSEVTGYEELEQYGNWSTSAEYGPVWEPRGLSAGWAPYSQGRWTWLEPWGWTWIDAAPWGYAPSHYGSWVMLNQRWMWAPGRERVRPVWAPALVGWAGGNQWQATRGGRGARGPQPGWFPLSPRDRFVPAYRASPDYGRRFDNYRDGKPGFQAHRGPQLRPGSPQQQVGGGGGQFGGRPVPVIRQSQEEMARNLQNNRFDGGPQRNEQQQRNELMRNQQRSQQVQIDQLRNQQREQAARGDQLRNEQQRNQQMQMQNQQREQQFRIDQLRNSQREQNARGEQLRNQQQNAQREQQQQNAQREQQQNAQRQQQQQNAQRQQQQQNEQRQRGEAQRAEQQRQQQSSAQRIEKHNEAMRERNDKRNQPQQER